MKTIAAAITFLIALGTLYGEESEREHQLRLELFSPSITREDAVKKGKNDAAEDIKNGNYKIIVYGLIKGFSDRQKKLEKEGVIYFALAGCMISDGIVGYAEGYNSTMKPFLEKKFGKELFEE